MSFTIRITHQSRLGERALKTVVANNIQELCDTVLGEQLVWLPKPRVKGAQPAGKFSELKWLISYVQFLIDDGGVNEYRCVLFKSYTEKTSINAYIMYVEPEFDPSKEVVTQCYEGE